MVLMLNAWRCMYGAECMTLQSWRYMHGVARPWCCMHGAACMVLHAWRCMHGAACMVLRAWRYMHGTACMVLHVWSHMHAKSGNFQTKLKVHTILIRKKISVATMCIVQSRPVGGRLVGMCEGKEIHSLFMKVSYRGSCTRLENITSQKLNTSRALVNQMFFRNWLGMERP
jgi:hypothetical protein